MQAGPSATPTTFREIERKLRVPEGFVLPPVAGVAPGVERSVPGEPFTMLAAYHDTEDLRLIRWGATLRRRTGGSDEGWHLKLPVDGEGPGVRDELALGLGAGEVGAVPEQIADIVAALVREAPLRHIATVRTRRAPYALLDGARHQVAELVYDEVEVVESEQVVRTFTEIEVEARVPDGGSTAVLDAVVDLLVAQGAVPGTEGKAAAAFGARSRGAPDVVVPRLPQATDPAGDTVAMVVAANVRKFLLEDVRVRRDLPDSVHQLRVAARTLRSALRTFAPLVDPEWATALREELRAAADALGVVRDTEVHLARLEEHARALEEGDAERALPVIDTWLRAKLEGARAAALAELRTPRHRQLLVDLVIAAHSPRLTPLADEQAVEVFPDLVEKAAHRLAKAVDKLTLGGPAEQWHRARILAKRARYAAEAVAPVLHDGAAAWGEAFERVTDLLGDHQDACTAQAMLREMATRADVDGPTGYALGVLDGYEVEREHADREEFFVVWPEVQRTLKRHKLA